MYVLINNVFLHIHVLHAHENISTNCLIIYWNWEFLFYWFHLINSLDTSFLVFVAILKSLFAKDEVSA